MDNVEGAKKIADDNMKQTASNLTTSFLKQIKDLETLIESRVKTAEATSKTEILNQAEIITNKVKEVDTIILNLINDNVNKIKELSDITAANKLLQEKSLTEEKQLLINKISDTASNAITNVADLKKYTDGRIDQTEKEYKQLILAVEQFADNPHKYPQNSSIIKSLT